jgi:hypothetical protein
MELVAKENEEWASLLRGQGKAFIASGLKFYALDLSNADAKAGGITTLNIIQVPFKSKMSPKAMTKLTLQQLESLESTVKPIAQRDLQIGGNAASELRYGMKMNMPGGRAVTMSALQFYMRVDNELLVMSFVTQGMQTKKQLSVFQKIASTFEPQLVR